MHIHFEYIGGCRDGEILGDDSDDPDEVTLVSGFYLMTGNGTEGRRFWVASDHAIATLREGRIEEARSGKFKLHYYEVAERLEEGDHVLVRAKFIGTNSQN